ncbi:MBL fold metallo-hydrolase [Marinicella sediminis]|uniref:MBL fold metallo-hydrolase n=1 Tax=Marinicella sediminis TaxID=1792834 RepID=A0ABV7J887_9GAMM|nr:MBL fold metallo-hydrolase [Marinicella sediminis]
MIKSLKVLGLMIGLLVVLGLISGCWRSAQYLKPPGDAAHHGEKQFISRAQNSSPLLSYLRMRWREGTFVQPENEMVMKQQQSIDMALLQAPAALPRFTWLGHATVLIQFQDVTILTDPHLSALASPVGLGGPERLIPPALSVDQLPSVDVVVISHNHYDHLDHETVIKLGNQVTWLVPWGLKQWFLKRDIDEQRVIEMDWWQTHQYNEFTTVTATPTRHWSKRTPFDTNKTLWNSWHVNIDGFKVWFAGDTGYEADYFRRIGEQLGPHDLSLIPIGAYGPEYFMLPQHVNPSQAVQIHQDVRSNLSLGIHWGTFLLTHEPYLEPKEWLEREVMSTPELKPFITMKVGETRILSPP